MKYCISTFSSGNHYQFFIPMFVYTAKRAYPDVYVKVFVQGSLKEPTVKALNKIRTIYDGFEVKENVCSGYPTGACGLLRFLMPAEEFPFKYVLFKDIDFLFFKNTPSEMYLFAKRMKKDMLSYFGTRGPYRVPRRPSIYDIGWKLNYTRIAGGTFMASKEWFKATESIRTKYRGLVKHSEHDDFDKHKILSYREQDEVCLYRICELAGLKTPKIKSKYTDGKGVRRSHRQLHIGDWAKKRNLKRVSRLRRKITKSMARDYIKMDAEDMAWREIKLLCCQHASIRQLIRRIGKTARSIA